MNRPSHTLDFDVVFKVIDQKSADGSIQIEGYANTIDKDRIGDVVLPDAFKKSLPTYMDNPVLLFQHDWDKIIGCVTDAKINDKGLHIKAKISGAHDCDDVRTKIREGVLRTLSIGYNEVDSVYNSQTKTKIVKDLDLLEVSVVTIPANTNAKFKPVSGENVENKGVTILFSENVAKLLQDDTMVQEVAEYLKSTYLEKGKSMETKAETVPMDQKPGEAKPMDEKPKDEGMKQEAGNPDHPAKVIELLTGILECLKEQNKMCKGCGEKPKEDKKEPANKLEDTAPKGEEKPKDEYGMSPKKSLEEMSQEEVTKELAESMAELKKFQ